MAIADLDTIKDKVERICKAMGYDAILHSDLLLEKADGGKGFMVEIRGNYRETETVARIAKEIEQIPEIARVVILIGAK